MAKTPDSVEFVRNLEIVDYFPPFKGPKLGTAVSDGKKQGFVDDGSLVSFTVNLQGQDKQDVLNSTLLAQLAASKKYDREKQTKEWYQFYVHVLENVGWVIQSFSFKEYQSGSSTFTMDKAVLQLLAAVASGNEAAAMVETIKALEKLPGDDNRVVLFNRESSKLDAGNFQIMPCDVDKSGQVIMGLGAFYFSTTKNVTRFLFWEFDSSSTHMYYGTEKVTLNGQIYGKVRDEIIKKLGDKATSFVHDLDI